MSKAYRNFWSLNVDEAIVSGILRDETSKSMEVLFPLNSQMKDIDLFLMNTKNNKSVSIQVKSSRAYEPKKSEIRDYGYGSAGWFYFDKKVIHDTCAKYFIFLVYTIEDLKEQGRRSIVPHTITISTIELQKLCKKYKTPDNKGRYNFFIWINSKTKEAFDYRNVRYSLCDYLDKKGFIKIEEAIK